MKLLPRFSRYVNKHSFRNSVLACALGLSLVAPQAEAAFKVVGYFPSWSGDVNTIQYNKVTHINYSFLLPNPDGSLRNLDGGGARLQSLVQKAHSAGVKVLIAVGGWNDGDDSAFRSLAANSGYRSNFVSNVVNFVNQYHLDGVDIDWEYPNGNEVGSFRLLMQQLSSALHSRGKLLSAAVTANDSPGSVDSTIINAVDFLNLMVYDMGNPHSTYSGAQAALTHWKYNEGLPKDKMILGVPFYSHINWVSYKDVIARYGAWAAQVDNAGGLDYNGQPTIRAKSELALMEAGGVMFWEISQDTRDDTSLMSTIWDVVGSTVQSGGSGGNTGGGSGSGSGSGYPAWQGGHSYGVGDIVSYNSKLYIAVHANPGYDPVISHWFWDEYNGGSAGGGNTGGGSGSGTNYPAWQGGQSYGVGDIVSYNGKLYITVHANPGYDPVISHWFWDEYNAGSDSGNSTGGSNTGSGLTHGGIYRITAKHSGRVIDVSGISNSSGANIHQWSYVGGNNQKWRAIEKGNGAYQFQAVHSGKCMDVSASSKNNGANIDQWTCHSGLNQQFKLENQGGGYYYLKANHSGKCVDVNGVSYSNGGSIHQWECLGQDNAKWKFEKLN